MAKRTGKSREQRQHIARLEATITKLEQEVEQLQMLDTQGLENLQEENRVRSVALDGLQKENKQLKDELTKKAPDKGAK